MRVKGWHGTGTGHREPIRVGTELGWNIGNHLRVGKGRDGQRDSIRVGTGPGKGSNVYPVS